MNLRPNHPRLPARNSLRRKAFTAFETLLATAILAMLAAAVSSALSAGRQQTRFAQDTLNASLMARGLLDEVLRLPFTDPSGYTSLGPDPGESTRITFDNIDDYHNFTDGPTGLRDLAGNLYPAEFQYYKRTVAIYPLGVAPSGWSQTIAGQLVTVTVSRDGKPLATLQRFVPAN